ncbi:MAG: DUF2490 domain-containing protein [Tenacibaculum sp.]
MKKILLLFVLSISLNSIAQSNAEKELGVWYMYNGSHKLSPKFSLKSMAHFRFFEIGDDMQQFIGRIGGNYKINNNLSATIGYAFLNTDGINSYNVDGGEVNEHRIYEDFNIKHKIADLKFAHRLRAEHRFYNSQTGHFIRYQLGLSHPLSEKWSTYIYDEIFFDFDGEPFNQNWLGVGFKYKLSNSVKLQAGYMNISDANSISLDRIQLGISINTNHFKTTK